MALTGSLHGARAFHYHYAVSTTVTLHGSGSRIGSLLTLRNLSSEPLVYMYLAHINFRPLTARYYSTPHHLGACAS